MLELQQIKNRTVLVPQFASQNAFRSRRVTAAVVGRVMRVGVRYPVRQRPQYDSPYR